MAQSAGPRKAGRLIAEFLVIAGGVLMALLADEWRGNRNDRSLAESYMQRLAVDLRNDLRSWTRTSEDVAEQDSALAVVQRWTADPRLQRADLERLADDLITATRFSTGIPIPRRATFDELLSTGRLSLIQDPALLTELGFHYREVDLEINRLGGQITGLHTLVQSLVPRQVSGLFGGRPRPGLPMETLQSMADRMLLPDIRPLLLAERNRAAYVLIVAGRRLERTSSLLELIASTEN